MWQTHHDQASHPVFVLFVIMTFRVRGELDSGADQQEWRKQEKAPQASIVDNGGCLLLGEVPLLAVVMPDLAMVGARTVPPPSSRAPSVFRTLQ